MWGRGLHVQSPRHQEGSHAAAQIGQLLQDGKSMSHHNGPFGSLARPSDGPGGGNNWAAGLRGETGEALSEP